MPTDKNDGSTEYERIIDSSPTDERVSASEMADALDAFAVGPTAKRGSPHSIHALQRRVSAELMSTGGRPARKGATVVRRVPLTRAESLTLSQVTRLIRRQGVNATPGQVAAALLHQSLNEVGKAAEKPRESAAARAPDDVLEQKLEQVLAAAASARRDLEELGPIAKDLLAKMRSRREAHKYERAKSEGAPSKAPSHRR
jgi:hypothetical protein